MISTGKGVEKILGRKGRRSGGKRANRERGERSKEGKGRSSQGGLRRERAKAFPPTEIFSPIPPP